MPQPVHRMIQEQLLNKALLVFGVIVIPTLIACLFLVADMGWQPVFLFNILLTFVIVIFAFFRKSIAYPMKVLFLVAVYFLIAVSSTLNFGLSGFLLEFLMLSVFVGVVFGGQRQGVLIYCGAMATIILVGILHVAGLAPLLSNTDQYNHSITVWVAVLTTFGFITGLVILIAGEVNHLLMEKIDDLQKMNQALQAANMEIQNLQGILPICAQCKKIRDTEGYWSQVEKYIEDHSDAKFSHGLCEECMESLYGDQAWYRQRKSKKLV